MLIPYTNEDKVICKCIGYRNHVFPFIIMTPLPPPALRIISIFSNLQTLMQMHGQIYSVICIRSSFISDIIISSLYYFLIQADE